MERDWARKAVSAEEAVGLIQSRMNVNDAPPPVQSYGVGSEAPKEAPGLGIASGIASVAGQFEVLIVNPVSNTLFFYMDGMNFTSGSYPGYRQQPRAVETINRSVRETEPGVYTASEYLQEDRNAALEEESRLRFRLKDPLTGWPLKGLPDARLLYYLSPWRYRTEVPAREVEEGVYEAALRFRESGAYNVHVGVPSRKIGYQTFIHRSLVVRKNGAADEGGGSGGKEPEGAKGPK